VYFPEKATQTRSDDGRVLTREVSEVRNARVNQTLPADTFQLDFNPGTKVQDLIQGKKYTVGPDGRSETAVGDLALPGPPLGLKQLTETKSEPSSLTAWLLPASLLLLAVGGGLWLVRRWRARSA
jgi:hypothetical protein